MSNAIKITSLVRFNKKTVKVAPINPILKKDPLFWTLSENFPMNEGNRLEENGKIVVIN